MSSIKRERGEETDDLNNLNPNREEEDDDDANNISVDDGNDDERESGGVVDDEAGEDDEEEEEADGDDEDEDERQQDSMLSAEEIQRRKLIMSRELGIESDAVEAEEGDADEDEERKYFEEDSDDEGEDLFGDNMMDDYELLEEENYYDPTLLDDGEYAPMSYEQRRAAEVALEERERDERGDDDAHLSKMREAGMLHDDMDGQEHYESIYDDPNIMRWDDEDDELETGDDDDVVGDLAAHLSKDKKETVANQEFRKLYSKTFKSFLEEFELGGTRIYYQKIEKAAQSNNHSVLVDYGHLTAYNPILSLYLTDVPDDTLTIMNEVLHKKVKELYPNFDKIHQEWFVRFYGLSVSDTLRDLRHTHLNILLSVKGVITRRTSVFPQLKVVKYDCGKCGGLIGPIILNGAGSRIPKPNSCPSCQSKGPFNINQTQTVYQNYQKITLQESPGSVSAGRIPRSKDVILLNDLIDCARPGDEVEVTGVYKHSYNAMLNVKQGFPVFSTVIEANSVRKTQDKIEFDMLSETEKKYMDKLKKCKNLQHKIVNSIAPSIFGHEEIKLAIALAMIGTLPKTIDDKHSVRGDINILLVGDPGTAKSQFLKYIEKTARRAVYTTGKGSTAVGLTASVRKDPVTNEWTLEGGALVLADRGVCLIDEFDKMNDQDRTSIHEAMEQQTISISKAGIVTTLQARCSVVAAANPVRGRYDTSRTFKENVDLTDPILSRFDVLSVVKDTVDPAIDERLARFVVDSHSNSHPISRRKKQIEEQRLEVEERLIVEEKENWYEDNELPIPQDFLKKYIARAKDIVVRLDGLDKNRLKNFYVDLRRDSRMGGGVMISVRHLESLIRMAEANARLHLRDRVNDDDVSTAIRLMLDSYISTQKYAVARTLRKKYQNYLKSPKDNNQVILHLVNQIVTELVDKETEDPDDTTLTIDVQLITDRVRSYDIHSIDAFLADEKLLEANYLSYDDERNVLLKTFYQ